MVNAGTAAIVTAIITASLGFVLTADGPLIQPLFVSSIAPDESYERTFISVTNVGVEQAKNAVLQIESQKELVVNYYSCHEGTINDGASVFTINFARMSYGIDCKIWFDGRVEGDIHRLIVTSDNAIGHEWSEDGEYNYLVLWAIAFAGVGIIISGGLTAYFGSKKFREYKEDKLLESSDLSRKSELKQEIKNISLEKTMLKNSITAIKDPEQVNFIQNKIDYLDLKEYEIKNELDEVYGIIGTKKNSRELIGEIFSDWASIEETIMKIGKENNIDVRIKNPIKIIQMLSVKDGKFKFIYNSIRDFRPVRNNLAHKTVPYKNEELERYSNELKEFVKTLEEFVEKEQKSKKDKTPQDNF